MENQRAYATGGLTLVAAGLVAVALVWGGDTPTEERDTRPAGHVEVVDTTTTVPTTTTDAPIPVVPELPVDNGPVNAPVNPEPPAHEDIPEIAPGNPLGDYEQRPDPGNPEPDEPHEPLEHPTVIYQGPPPRTQGTPTPTQ